MKKWIMMVSAAAALAGCVMDDGTGRVNDASPAALAALPEGIDPGFLIRDENGCYGIVLEATETPQGPPLRDAFGQQVCDPPRTIF